MKRKLVATLEYVRSAACLPCDEGHEVAVAAARVAAAAAFASLSTLSASLICGVEGPGIPRKWVPPVDMRLGAEEDWAEDEESGDSSDAELLREGMESGCR